MTKKFSHIRSSMLLDAAAKGEETAVGSLLDGGEQTMTFANVALTPLGASLDLVLVADAHYAGKGAANGVHGGFGKVNLDAASTAKSFFNVAKRLGVHCWYDMDQANLTLEGMKQGVRDSDVLLLILTQHVLERWFCQQELLTAVDEGARRPPP